MHAYLEPWITFSGYDCYNMCLGYSVCAIVIRNDCRLGVTLLCICVCSKSQGLASPCGIFIRLSLFM